jgi:hypothetical protein
VGLSLLTEKMMKTTFQEKKRNNGGIRVSNRRNRFNHSVNIDVPNTKNIRSPQSRIRRDMILISFFGSQQETARTSKDSDVDVAIRLSIRTVYSDTRELEEHRTRNTAVSSPASYQYEL